MFNAALGVNICKTQIPSRTHRRTTRHLDERVRALDRRGRLLGRVKQRRRRSVRRSRLPRKQHDFGVAAAAGSFSRI